MTIDTSLEQGGLFSVRGKSAVITGGTQGIGKMIAAGLVDAGARVIICSRKDEDCRRAEAELSQYGSCVAIAADLATPEGVDSFVACVERELGELHILVNNAGTTWGQPLEDYPDAAFDRVFSLNVKAVFRLTTKMLPLLRAAARLDDPARVINIGSIDGLIPSVTDNFAYGASKAAVHMLTRKLAGSLAAESITVNAIAPGPFRTKMMAFALEDPTGRRKAADRVPLGRLGSSADIAGAVIYLGSPAGAYVTGSVLPVDGGRAALANQ